MNQVSYYILDTEKFSAEGPYNIADLQKMREVGLLSPTDFIAEPGDEQWERIYDNGALVEGLFPNYEPPAEETFLNDREDTLADPENLHVKDHLKVNRKFEDPNALIPALKKEDALRFKGLSRKMKDYLLLIVVGNIVFWLLMLFVGINQATVGFGAAFTLMFTSALAFVMFFVMDRY